MKTITCSQLGGACDKVFQAETMEEIAELCRKHHSKMCQAGDRGHLQVREDIQDLLKDTEALTVWWEDREQNTAG